MLNETTVEYLLLACALLAILLPIVGGRAQLPLLNVLARWMRWFLFAAIFAFILRIAELSLRPDWVHFVAGLGVWFLLETGYNWIAIKALSNSDLPLFPNFKVNRDGDEWPADKELIELKDWLRKEDFKPICALKAELFEDTYLRASVYESGDQLTRIQVLFVPKRKGDASACYTISTVGENGQRLITDNHFLPFGGYYPEAWNQSRKPLIGRLSRLLMFHQKRLIQSNLTPIAFEDTPLEEINEQQRILERLNTDYGFLVQRTQQEEEGQITYNGRYRLWKEMWMLAYFGKSVS
ncbi:MAG: hypothetical protein ACPGES_06390 [Coraliomargarita sp.]